MPAGTFEIYCSRDENKSLSTDEIKRRQTCQSQLSVFDIRTQIMFVTIM